jgi:hypothetical protein
MDRDLLLRPNLATMDLRNHIDAELRVGRGRPLARALLLGGHGRGQPGGIGRWAWSAPFGKGVGRRRMALECGRGRTLGQECLRGLG